MKELIYPIVGYIILLTVVCGYMAFRARKLPENYSETLVIFYAMFTNIMLWLPIFILCYKLSSSKHRDQRNMVFAGVNIAGTFCLLLILYVPKLFIILLYPELNTKAHFRRMAASNTMLTFLKDIDPQHF